MARSKAPIGRSGPPLGMAKPAAQAVAGLLREAEQKLRAGAPAAARTTLGRALSSEPQNPDALHMIAVACLQLGETQEAVNYLRRAIAAREPFPLALNTLGGALLGLGRHEAAASAYRRAIAQNPNFADAHDNLGVALRALGQSEEARDSHARASELDPKRAIAFANLGLVEFELGFHDKSVEALEMAVQLAPQLAEAQFRLGQAYGAQGRMDEAKTRLAEALRLRPGLPKAAAALAMLTNNSERDGAVEELEAIFQNERVSPADRVRVAYAIGKAREDRGETAETVFAAYAEGASLKHELTPHDRDADRRFYRAIKDAFEQERFDAAKAGHDDPSPIFVIGLPRSGTTLTEQILASHSQVFGAGELTDLQRVITQVWGDPKEAGLKRRLEKADADSFATAGKLYVERVRARGIDAPRFVDKLPHNFRYAGFIRLMLPKARIVHLRRDVRAVGWSIFRTLFTRDTHSYSYDQKSLAGFINAYQDLMQHWRSIAPSAWFYEQEYEALVEDPEPQVRALLEACGLEWEAACLDFHKTKRAVATASYAQVRKPMYKTSLKDWQRYEDQLGPFLNALGTTRDPSL
ncbi:MAG: sulfotransferase [Pseudomonadota bacterium]